MDVPVLAKLTSSCSNIVQVLTARLYSLRFLVCCLYPTHCRLGWRQQGPVKVSSRGSEEPLLSCSPHSPSDLSGYFHKQEDIVGLEAPHFEINVKPPLLGVKGNLQH